MEFVFKKVIIEGVEPAYKYECATGMIPNIKLPYDYLYEDGAHVRLNKVDEGIVYTEWEHDTERYLYPNDIISIDEFDEFVAISHMAGERLYRIKQLQKWHGMSVVIV